MENKMDFNGISEAFSQLNAATKNLNSRCIEFLADIVKKQGGLIDMDDFSDAVSIVYNGGNHPEYASGYSTVHNIHLNDDNRLYVGIDEDDDYSIEDLSASELYYIALVIYEEIED